MLLLKSIRRHQDRSMMRNCSHLRSLSLRVRVLHPNTCIDVRLLGPCFKTGDLRSLCQHPCFRSPQPKVAASAQAITLNELLSCAILPPLELMLAQKDKSSKSDLKSFPFNNFTFFFTLFSKFFSSFHHCTCSLSVSRQYLALDGIYHPLRAAFPNNSTRRGRFT